MLVNAQIAFDKGARNSAMPKNEYAATIWYLNIRKSQMSSQCIY